MSQSRYVAGKSCGRGSSSAVRATRYSRGNGNRSQKYWLHRDKAELPDPREISAETIGTIDPKAYFAMMADEDEA